MSPQQPSDPISGGSEPPEGTPARPSGPGGSSAASSSGRRRRPWWQRSAVLAPAAGVAALATALAVVLTQQPPNRSKQPSAGGTDTVALQSASAPGPAPFTPSVARTAASGPATGAAAGAATGAASGSSVASAAVTGEGTSPAAAGAAVGAPGGVRSVQGSAAGLYGGTEQLSSCDIAQLSDYLAQHPDKAQAWAGVEGVPVGSLSGYLRSLTPVVLRLDTSVTNYGFSHGSATPFSAVLEAGTAVLIDARGLPRARCACGNPLRPAAAATNTAQTFTGTAWGSFRPGNVVVVNESVTQVNVVVLYDQQLRIWFERPTGGQGGGDHRVPPPPGAWRPGALPSTSWSAAPSGSPSASGASPWTSPSRTASHSASPSHAHSPSHSPSPSQSPSASPSASASHSHWPPTSPSLSPSLSPSGSGSGSPTSAPPSSAPPSSAPPSSAGPSTALRGSVPSGERLPLASPS